MKPDVAIIGAGGLGTAIAQLISINSNKVYLYARRKELVEEMEKTRHNIEYYPNNRLNDNIIPVNTFEVLKDCSVIFLCVPSSAFRKTVIELDKYVNESSVIVSTAKGIEYPSINTMSSIFNEYHDNDIVVFSGPNFASEIILKLFTVADIASSNEESLKIVESLLTTKSFRVKKTNDVIGTELCGILKNINAIAYGICEGMNINDNARYAILTKGFNETKEIITKLGGDRDTVNGYCGFGDMVLTSTSRESRNHTLGMLYGQRIVVDEKSSGIIFEGKKSIKSIKQLCDEHKIESLIVNFVYDVIVNNINPKKAFRDLWDHIE